MDSYTGACLSPVPDFDICIALGSYKPSHFLQPAASSFAQLVCADIGLDPSARALHPLPKPLLSAPTADSHQYNRGLAAVAGGFMPCASILAAEAAARTRACTGPFWHLPSGGIGKSV